MEKKRGYPLLSQKAVPGSVVFRRTPSGESLFVIMVAIPSGILETTSEQRRCLGHKKGRWWEESGAKERIEAKGKIIAV